MVANAGETKPARLLRGDVGNGELPRADPFLAPLLALATRRRLIAIVSASDPMFAACRDWRHGPSCAIFALLGLAIRRLARGA